MMGVRFFTYYATQWPAVTTHFLAISAPPQAKLPFLIIWAMKGQACGSASCPLKISVPGEGSSSIRSPTGTARDGSAMVPEIYSRTSMARTPLGPWKSIRAMGSSSQWRLIMAPGRKANIANSGKSIDLLYNNCMLSALIRIASLEYTQHNFVIK